MLDTVELSGLSTELTFIDPYPQRLHGLLSQKDAERCTIVEDIVQEVPLSTFDSLGSGDILFVDSSHVAKAGSDVAHIFLRILPRLRPGVIVHIHDIFYPHSYPIGWLRNGWAWNESLFLRAFLAGGSAFEVVLFNSYAGRAFPELFEAELPQFMKNTGGSFWMRRPDPTQSL